MRSSTLPRSSLPAAVSSPSPSSRPRTRNPSTPSDHCSRLQPRRRLPNSGAKPVPVATWVISASMPLSPCATNAAIWPSPRYSRSRVIACHNWAYGASGQSNSACPAYNGRPSAFGIASAVRRTIAVECANCGEETRSSPRIPRQRRVDDFVPHPRHGFRRCHVPGGGNGLRYQLGIEVIERRCNNFRGDRSHRGRPAREVLHARFQAELAEPFAGLGYEIDRRMQPVE